MKDLKDFYKKYKNAIIITTFILAFILVVFQVVFPQIDKMQVTRSEIEENEKVVIKLRDTVNVLASISDQDLERYYDLTQGSLPQVKDIMLIFNSLLSVADDHQVELGEMTINLGDIYSRDEKPAELSAQLPHLGSPSVAFSVNIDGDVSNIRAFAQSLYRTIPVVEIDAVEIRNNRGELSAHFFYKPLKIRSVEAEESAKPFAEGDLTLLSQLQEWADSLEEVEEEIVVADDEDEELTPTPSITVTPTIEITPTE